MACSGLAVVGIGLLMYPVLKQVNPTLALWYPTLRIAECLVSAACGVYLLARSEVVPNHLLWVYVPTGIGGIILCYLLFVARLVPRPIALLGLVGYASLTIGVPLDLLGVLDMGAGAGMLLGAHGVAVQELPPQRRRCRWSASGRTGRASSSPLIAADCVEQGLRPRRRPSGSNTSYVVGSLTCCV